MDPLAPVEQHGLRISSAQWESMKQHVDFHAPQEACGLLAGKGVDVSATYPITNILQSRVQFRMQPEEQLMAFLEIEEQGLDLVGIYHSHPAGPQYLSSRDIDEAYYPEVVHLIWFIQNRSWSCLGYRIQDGQSVQVPIQVGA